MVVLVVAVALVTSRWSDAPPTQPTPAASPSVGKPTARTDIAGGLFARSQRNAHIRDVPTRYRDAASLASAMRDGRTPGNFFLALAYDKTLYGELLVQSIALTFVQIGPLQWSHAEFDAYADPAYRDISKPLDSFLAVDTALHLGHDPDFSAGAFGPARLLGMNVDEAQAVAAIYDVLNGAGIRAD